MEQWALVLAYGVLVMVALAGGVVTLVRIRRVGGLAAVLAGVACGVLVLAVVFDMIWWTQVYPTAVDRNDADTASTLNGFGILGTLLMISTGVALLIASTNVRRSPVAEPADNPRTAPQPAPQAGFPVRAPVFGPTHPVPPQAQPASGWTPPQQTQPDWNIHSGVWSIPRGTFDGPPPDQRHPR